MLDGVLILFLLFLCVLICGIFTFVGFYCGTKVTVVKNQKKAETDPAEVNAKIKAEKALKNFLEYTGDVQ